MRRRKKFDQFDLHCTENKCTFWARRPIKVPDQGVDTLATWKTVMRKVEGVKVPSYMR
jgi:hypothetical protein